MSALACMCVLLTPSIPAQESLFNRPRANNPYENAAPGLYLGYAGIMSASGKLMIDTQQALLMREDVRSAQLDNRRKRLEQWLWERDNLPKPEDERRRFLAEQLRRSRYNPPLTEIWSARSLNDLFTDLAMVENLSAQDQTPIDPAILERINLTTGKGSGNAGFLKGDLKWRPQLLCHDGFASETDQLVALVIKAADGVVAGKPDPKLVGELYRRHRVLRNKLTQLVRTSAEGDFTPSMYIDARVYLEQLNDVIKLLQRPDAARALDTRLSPKGKTVAELVQYMKDNGLHFASSTAGSEDAYTALHHAMAGASRRVGSPTEKK